MIEAIELTKEFVRQEKRGKKTTFAAVDHLSMQARKGEILGILGPNGAGKTTLLRMLGSLMEPTSGRAVLREEDGREVTNAKERKLRIGYLSENTKLYGRFSARELLSVFAELYGLSRKETSDRIEEIASLLRMEEFIDHRIDRFSTGQKQRTSIARCLMADPDYYIFDEPTLGLDVISSRTIIDFMQLERERGKCVLYSTHYMEEAEYLCDRILMMDHGRIIAEGTPGSLLEKSGCRSLREAFFALTERAEGMTEEKGEKD